MPKSPALSDGGIWCQALEKFGAAARLTVTVFSPDAEVVCGPVPSTPLFALFDDGDRAPDILAQCARQCLAQRESRPAVVIAPSYGLAVVGTSLVLDGDIVGAAVAAYAVVDFVQPEGIERLARATGVPFKQLWSIALQQQPISQAKLMVQGELLQVLGDTILKEIQRTMQLEETAARLEQEMSAKDEFFAVLSHELRTPLTPILNWVDVLKRGGNDPGQQQRAMESIERNARLQVKLIDDLLDLNGIIHGKVVLDLSTNELTTVVHAAVDTISESASRKKVNVEVSVDPQPVYVEADAARLQQVFGNILSNAVKFTPPGGTIRVTVEGGTSEGTVRITDSGAGITGKFLPHVFDIFRQQEKGTRRTHAGLGIGLALVKQLVEMHGGSVEVASAGEGLGTDVTVRLPVQRLTSGAGVPGIPIRAHQSTALDDLTILLIEDTEDTRAPMRELLEEYGAHVLEAANGSVALRMLAANRPDVVLCDLRMPIMDGFEFMRTLVRARGRDHPPVVALSGLASRRDRERTQAAGFEGHLSKPFAMDALVATVCAALKERKSA
jgi:signal transduction histidine kinase/ActR/RegA family two-component response regulator